MTGTTTPEPKLSAQPTAAGGTETLIVAEAIPPDPVRLEAFVGRMVSDMGAAMSGALIITGTKLGLYKALQDGGPATSSQLAARVNAAERYVREWLSAQAASGYVDYDSASGQFSLSPEQAMVFANEDSPVYLAPAYEVIASGYIDEQKVTDAFLTGKGVGWHEHHECLFRGTERFFRPGYRAHLVQDWLPALDGVVAKLEAGAKVADIGCGAGASRRRSRGRRDVAVRVRSSLQPWRIRGSSQPYTRSTTRLSRRISAA